jgi:long-chain fatty acid transport protein
MENLSRSGAVTADGPGRAVAVLWLLSLLFACPTLAIASNGVNLLASSAEGVGMAGADVPVARDALALTTNPSGLVQIPAARFDGLLGVGYAMDIRHSDQIGNDEKNDNRYASFVNGAVALPIEKWGVTLGAALSAQGGSGIVFDNLETPFGNQDKLSSVFRIARGSAGIAFRLNDRWSLGVSPTVFYADLEQRIFPHTSFAGGGSSFFGLRVEDMRGFSGGVRVGALYEATDWLTVGAAYATEAPLDLRDGKVRANMTAIGLGKVKYRDAEVDGFKVPREASLGFAVRPVADLLVALELTWINWDSAFNTLTLKASDPDNPAAPAKLEIPTRLDWRDQYVIAVGLAYEPTDALILRAGYNYARNPIPNDTLNPLLATITQHHVTVGAGYRFGASWELNGAFEYHIPEKATYTNPEQPFGPDTRVKVEDAALWLQLTYKW